MGCSRKLTLAVALLAGIAPLNGFAAVKKSPTAPLSAASVRSQLRDQAAKLKSCSDVKSTGFALTSISSARNFAAVFSDKASDGLLRLKGDYEATADFEASRDKAALDTFGSVTNLIIITKVQPDQIAYDADAKELTITTPDTVNIASSAKSKGMRIGQNGFGVKGKYEVLEKNDIWFHFSPQSYKSLQNTNGSDYQRKNKLALNNDVAKRTSENLYYIVLGDLYAPYIVYSDDTTAPTFDDPYQVSQSNTTILLNVKCAYIYNKETGEVLLDLIDQYSNR